MNTELNKTFTHKITIDVAFTMEVPLTEYDSQHLISKEDMEIAFKQQIQSIDRDSKVTYSKFNISVEDTKNE